MTLGGDGFAISSWGWLDDEGQPSLRGQASFRLWSVNNDTSKLAFIAMPVDAEPIEVLRVAIQAFQLRGQPLGN